LNITVDPQCKIPGETDPSTVYVTSHQEEKAKPTTSFIEPMYFNLPKTPFSCKISVYVPEAVSASPALMLRFFPREVVESRLSQIKTHEILYE
jgi:hypothetical protein